MYAMAPKRMSLLAFCAANVLIDVEPLYFMLTEQYPLHRFFHTYIGASLVVLLILGLFISVRKLSRITYLPNILGWKQLEVMQIFVGATLGAYSHIALDSLMHGDIQPFAPFSEANPLLGIVSLDALHGSCVISGIAGIIIVVFRWNAR